MYVGLTLTGQVANTEALIKTFTSIMTATYHAKVKTLRNLGSIEVIVSSLHGDIASDAEITLILNENTEKMTLHAWGNGRDINVDNLIHNLKPLQSSLILTTLQGEQLEDDRDADDLEPEAFSVSLAYWHRMLGSIPRLNFYPAI